MEEKQNILIYQNADGNIKLDVHLQDDSVWVTQGQMAQLFGKAKSTINEHIGNIYKEGELEKALTTQKFGNSEFPTKTAAYMSFHCKAIRASSLTLEESGIL
ncbi:MAG: cell filamentation protein Fic [Bacteroidetes bacterium]|nr:MAG: cell filamentation protein Fic [Bacteroidota bacterium]